MTNIDFIFVCFTGECNDDTEFTCSSGEKRCIPISYVQDGDNDCEDGSDEYSPYDSTSTTFLLDGRSEGTVDLLPGN